MGAAGRDGRRVMGGAWLLVALVLPVSADARQLRFDTPPGRGGVGARLGPLVVSRVADSGEALPAAELTETTLTVFTDSVVGEFTLSKEPTATWSKVVNVRFPAGAAKSAPVFFRDRATGTPRVVAQVPGYTDIVQTFVVDALTFSADFETGTLLESQSPPGPFATQTIVGGGVGQPVPSTAAAHRGRFGARSVDTEPTRTGMESGAEWYGAPLSPSVHVRCWIRVSEDSTSSGGVVPLSIGTGFPGPTIQDLLLIFPEGGGRYPTANGQGHDASGAIRQNEGSKQLRLGGWHLIELFVTGLDTPSGTREVWVDGELSARQSPVDLRGMPFSVVRIGELWAKNAPFTGSFDLDDLRVSTAPQGSRLRLAISKDRVAPGACLTVSATLRDSMLDVATAAPYDFEATLDLTGPGAANVTVHEDGSCGRLAGAATMPFTAGSADAAPRSLRVTTVGALAIGLHFPDFLQANDQIQVLSPPVARVSPAEADVQPGEEVSIDARASEAAPPASIVHYGWALTRGPTGVKLSEGPVQQPVLEAPGEYWFELTVTDSNGMSSEPVVSKLRVLGERPGPPERLGCSAHLGAPWLAVIAGAVMAFVLRVRGGSRRARSRPPSCAPPRG